MNRTFREFVTSASFHLTLSQQMCWLLLKIQEENERPPSKEWLRTPWSGYGHFIPTVKCLESRGLVQHYKDGKKVKGKIQHHVLTEEGKLVAELVRRAGIVTFMPSKAANAA